MLLTDEHFKNPFQVSTSNKNVLNELFDTILSKVAITTNGLEKAFQAVDKEETTEKEKRD